MSRAAVVAIVVVLLAGCGGSDKRSITVYNGQHPELTRALATAFEKQTGIKVQIRTGDGIVLASQLLQEGSRSPADVYFAENSPELEALDEHHLLEKLPASITNQIPSGDNSPSGSWVGVALRLSALVYNPSRISAAQLPAHLLDLANPAWKGKVAAAPTDSDFPPLVGGVIAKYGKNAAENWLRGLKANATDYDDDEAVVAAVDRGQVPVGIINQYYWYRLRLEQGAANTHSKLYYFPNRDIGTLTNISGAGVLASSHKKAQAESFLRFLVSAKAQRILAAGDDFEYPTRPGIAPNPALTPLSQIKPAVLTVADLGDDQEAASLVQQLAVG
jgi:iron(III) transport system substrate-binding protein